jgi:hypothetical protein
MAGRTIIAKHIIATAKAGNLNRQSLADGALLYLAKQKLHRITHALPRVVGG